MEASDIPLSVCRMVGRSARTASKIALVCSRLVYPTPSELTPFCSIEKPLCTHFLCDSIRWLSKTHELWFDSGQCPSLFSPEPFHPFIVDPEQILYSRKVHASISYIRLQSHIYNRRRNEETKRKQRRNGNERPKKGSRISFFKRTYGHPKIALLIYAWDYSPSFSMYFPEVNYKRDSLE